MWYLTDPKFINIIKFSKLHQKQQTSKKNKKTKKNGIHLFAVAKSNITQLFSSDLYLAHAEWHGRAYDTPFRQPSKCHTVTPWPSWPQQPETASSQFHARHNFARCHQLSNGHSKTSAAQLMVKSECDLNIVPGQRKSADWPVSPRRWTLTVAAMALYIYTGRWLQQNWSVIVRIKLSAGDGERAKVGNLNSPIIWPQTPHWPCCSIPDHLTTDTTLTML